MYWFMIVSLNPGNSEKHSFSQSELARVYGNMPQSRSAVSEHF